MSRIVFRLAIALTALVALVAVPGALAKSTHKAHRAHKHHTRAHHRSTTKTAKAKSSESTPNTSEHGAGDHPANGGDAHPVAPPPAPGVNAGTVTSFTGGVLAITLTGGATLTGTVAPGTPIVCRPANHTRTDTPVTGEHHEPAPTTTATTPPPPPPPATEPAPPPPPAPCGPSALVAGAVVHEAGLVLGPNGLRFTSIVLVQG